jgi:hypothetical protein
MGAEPIDLNFTTTIHQPLFSLPLEVMIGRWEGEGYTFGSISYFVMLQCSSSTRLDKLTSYHVSVTYGSADLSR